MSQLSQHINVRIKGFHKKIYQKLRKFPYMILLNVSEICQVENVLIFKKIGIILLRSHKDIWKSMFNVNCIKNKNLVKEGGRVGGGVTPHTEKYAVNLLF